MKDHETCIQMLDGIHYFETMIKHCQNSIDGLGGLLPDFKEKYLHNIDIYERCIDRLNCRYIVLLHNMFKEQQNKMLKKITY